MRRNKRMNRNSIPVSLLPNAQFELKEAYRSLRTNLQFLSVDSKLKSILVTSTQPMEGKTTVLVNLAMTLAIAGYKVLLVDMEEPSAEKTIWKASSASSSTLKEEPASPLLLSTTVSPPL